MLPKTKPTKTNLLTTGHIIKEPIKTPAPVAPKSKKVKQTAEFRKARLAEKHECICGGKYTYRNKSVHLKTKKHQDFENPLGGYATQQDVNAMFGVV